ncbi:putative sterigmatocystin biosynthesis P450 monooxygenase stcS [Colletotrichum trifolii]|uniref:Putative sterigmatocystin biosynthesis P450 monooxygenase stcS n=1 Tax=Colletotrichum trifolii TaxID=5466 RepID=A0A4R8RGZ6_COLTR|nr:putative sterigmatocystin biosynthesis P450 monooxygenase stcS [Colletotrichum trifolii]
MLGVSIWLIVSSAGVAWLGYLLLRLYQVRSFYKDKPKAPGHSFLWGHLGIMAEMAALMPPHCHPQYYLTEIIHRYNMPGVWYLDLWPIADPQLIVTDPNAAAQLLVVSPSPKHRAVEEFVRPVVGSGSIIAVNGEAWKFAHRLLGSGFSPSYVKPMLGMVADCVVEFNGRLREFALRGDVISIEEETAKAVFDIIGNVIFGISLDAQGAGSPLLGDLRRLMDYMNFLVGCWNPLKKAVEAVKMRAVRRRCTKVIEEIILDKYKVMKDEKQLPTRRQAKSIMDRIIADYIQSGNAGPPGGAFMESVVANLKTLLVGGHGTTTDTYTWMMTLLSIHPDAMERLRREHDDIFPPGLAESAEMLQTNPARTNELEYTTAVIKETLRLYPVGFTARTTPPGVKILDWEGNQFPLDGHMLSLNNFGGHYDPAIWKDPKVFRPERFLGEEGAALPRFAWRPFERGPRACMGQDLAMDQMRVLLLLTVRWFDWEVVPKRVNEQPKASYMDMDLRLGDLAFQEMKMGAAPRSELRMKVKLCGRG